jgi:transcriptional regulator with XRE-family HTH domain
LDMKRPEDRFDCDEELGRRLRECRLRAGLTQQKLATAMGRQGKGSHHVAGRLERGEVSNPSVGLVADYLRACRASFADILDVLDRYTGRLTVAEVETRRAVAAACKDLPDRASRAAEKYDRRVARRAESAREPGLAPAERVRRAQNYGWSQVWARRVRREVTSILDARHLGPGPLREHLLRDYAAKVWRILNRTRGQRAGERQALLAEAGKLFLIEGGPSLEEIRVVREGLLEFFSRLETAGELDARPGA